MSVTADIHYVVVATNQNLAETHYITTLHFKKPMISPYLHLLTVYPIFEEIEKELAENEAKYKSISKNGSASRVPKEAVIKFRIGLDLTC